MAENKETLVKLADGSEVKGTAVDLTQRVKAWATDKAPYHTAGQEINYAPAIIDDMVKRGFATKSEPKKKAE